MSGRHCVSLTKRRGSRCPSCAGTSTIRTETPGGTVLTWRHAAWCRVARIIAQAGYPYPPTFEPLPTHDRER